jgi:hypothetical protein
MHAPSGQAAAPQALHRAAPPQAAHAGQPAPRAAHAPTPGGAPAAAAVERGRGNEHGNDRAGERKDRNGPG